MKYAVSRIKMPPVREYASSLLKTWQKITSDLKYMSFKHNVVKPIMNLKISANRGKQWIDLRECLIVHCKVSAN